MKLKINGRLCESVEDVRQCASEKLAAFVEEFTGAEDSVSAHTSGSTGTPKEIRLLKSDMRASARLTNEFFGIGEDSVLYLCLSPDYIAGKMMIVRAMEAGAELVEQRPSNEPMAGYDSNRRVTLLAVVPSQIGYLLNHPEYLDMVDNLIIGGGALSERMEHWLADKGVKAYKTYGMTETCSHIALSAVSRESLPYTAIGDETFSVDSRGCLMVDAPQFTTRNIVTNDIVELVDSRNFHWRGRIDNVINTGGLKVFPEEVEQAIARILPRVKFYVTSRPSEKWGEELVMVLEYAGIGENVRKEGEVHGSLVEKLRRVLPPHAIPRHYIAVSHIPSTSSGKIIRKRL